MLHWFRRVFRFEGPPRSVVDDDVRKFQRLLLHYVIKRMDAMALDVSKLATSADRNAKAVAALVASHSDPAAQAVVDRAVVVLDDSSKAAEDAVAPAA